MPVKCLGGELQPFDGGEIRKDRRAEFCGGHAMSDRQHQCLNGVRYFGCHDLTSQLTVARIVGDQLDKAGCVPRSEELRVGIGCVGTCHLWLSRSHLQKKQSNYY